MRFIIAGAMSPAALGAKIGAPKREVITTVGDGSYMFGNPLPYHFVQRAEKLPILTIIFNNSLYGAVRGATMSMFKDGVAGQDGGNFDDAEWLTAKAPVAAFEFRLCALRHYRESGPLRSAGAR